MAATIEERGDGSYSFRLWVTDKDGKKKLKRFTIKAQSRRDAEKQYTKIRQEVDSRTYTPPSKLTVAQHLDGWLRDYKEAKLAAKTLEDYQTVIRNHLAPALGSIPLEKLGSL